MAEVKIKDEKSLEGAREKLQGTADLRRTKYGVIAAKSKWPNKRKKSLGK